MGTKNNFTQALRELTGFDDAGSSEKAAEMPERNYSAASSRFADAFDTEAPDVNPQVASAAEFETVAVEGGCTQITPNMVIKGDVIANDDLLIDGQVYGNVTTSANISASSLIIGDIKGENIGLSSARVKGNISLDGNLQVGEKTIVVGDINSGNIKISGKIKGNLDVADSAVLMSGALVSGNITADQILTEAGARINGAVITRSSGSDYDEAAEFDLGVDFDE